MGSGTTGLAALNLGRKFIGIEKNSETFEIASIRINKQEFERIKERILLNNEFYHGYEDRDDDRLGKNEWKISFYNYYKPCDFYRYIF